MLCSQCGNSCRVKRQDNSFDYAGTHCTFGRSGTEVVIDYVSDCCEANIETYNGNIMSSYELQLEWEDQ